MASQFVVCPTDGQHRSANNNKKHLYNYILTYLCLWLVGDRQEVKARQLRCEQLYQVGEELIASKHHASNEIQFHINSLQDKWQRLLDLVAKHRARLEDAQESHQVCVASVFTNFTDDRCVNGQSCL